MTESWWNPTLNTLASQLSRGILNEMKKRITTSNIRKEKLEPTEDSQRMKEFFSREIGRYERRKLTTRIKQDQARTLATKIVAAEDKTTELTQELEKLKKKYSDLKAGYCAQRNQIRKMEGLLRSSITTAPTL